LLSAIGLILSLLSATTAYADMTLLNSDQVKALFRGGIEFMIEGSRRSENFVIKARTDAAGVLGVDEAIERLNLFAEAGADLLFADALLPAEDIARVARNVSKPLSVNLGYGIRARASTPLIGPKDLEAMGVAAVIYPRLLTASALRGMMNAMQAFHEEVVANNGTPDQEDLMISFEELNDISGMDALEARYGGGVEVR